VCVVCGVHFPKVKGSKECSGVPNEWMCIRL
jgi:hypothetical protein